MLCIMHIDLLIANDLLRKCPVIIAFNLFDIAANKLSLLRSDSDVVTENAAGRLSLPTAGSLACNCSHTVSLISVRLSSTAYGGSGDTEHTVKQHMCK